MTDSSVLAELVDWRTVPPDLKNLAQALAEGFTAKQIALEAGVPDSLIYAKTTELRAWVICAALANEDLPASLRAELEQRPEARASAGD